MEQKRLTYRRALTIAGSASCGGAGIQADLKTFSALGVYGTTVVTAITAQNTLGVQAIEPVSARMVGLQIDSLLTDIGADAVKIGMLHDSEIIQTVADRLRGFHVLNLVLDPVMIAKGGTKLLDPRAIESLRRDLIPLTRLITPNIAETETLLDRKIRSDSEIENAAHQLMKLGADAVLIKGGHLDDPESRDCLATQEGVRWFSAPRVLTRNTHGTGCTLSAAIAARLALGDDLADAVQAAKYYLTAALVSGANYDLGAGHGPVNHYCSMR